MHRTTLVLLIREALKQCGMDTRPRSLMEIAMPLIHEQGSLNA